MIGFLPWFSIQQSLTIGSFEFLPFAINVQNPNPVQQEIISILAMYNDLSNRPIRTATIVKHVAKAVNDELTEDEMEEAYQIVNLLTIGGLIKRHHFSGPYVSTSNFDCIFQKYQMPIAGVSVSAKRKHGRDGIVFARGIFSEKCPSFVPLGNRNDLDLDFILALYRASTNLRREMWNRIYESILSYLSANTDSRQVNEFTELVLSVASLERLLNKKGNAFALRFAFHRLLREIPEQSLSSLKKVIPSRRQPLKFIDRCNAMLSEYNFKVPLFKPLVDPYDAQRTCKSLRTLWIADLYKARNRFAHGHRNLAHDSLWSIEEHLLFSSYIFPYLVKLILKNEAMYALTNSDRRILFTFDHLLGQANVFSNSTDPNHNLQWDDAHATAAWAAVPAGFPII